MSVQTIGSNHTKRLEKSPADRGLPWLLAALAVALVANTLAGPLVTDVVDYPVTGTLLSQLLGLEVVTVVLVAPMAAAAAVLLRRAHPLAPYLGVGAGSYTAYMFVQYVLGPSYTTYHPAVFLHLGIFTLGTAVAVWSWVVALRTPVPAPSAQRRRWTGVLVLALAAFVLTRDLPAMVGAATSAALPHEFAAAPAFFWSIVLLDLGLVVPAAAVTGIGLLRGARTAVSASYAVVVWFALVPVSVAAMSVAMLARGDAEASGPQAALLSTAALLFAALAGWVCRPLVRGTRTGQVFGRRRALAAYAALLAIAAYGGAAGLAFGFLGLPAELEQRLPFGSAPLGGLALALVVGLPATVVTVLAWRGDRRTDLATAVDGLLLIGWIAVELAFLRDLSFLHAVYALVGVSLVVWGRRSLGDLLDAAHHPLLRVRH